MLPCDRAIRTTGSAETVLVVEPEVLVSYRKETASEWLLPCFSAAASRLYLPAATVELPPRQ
jgi:hypothetical protein